MGSNTQDTKVYSITILAYPGMTLLDAVGPNEVLANSPYCKVQWVSSEAHPISNDFASFTMGGLRYFEDIEHTDVLLIPGGPGDHGAMQNRALLAWIQRIDQSTVYTTSVCTGALLLAKAGVLKGQKACTHWGCLQELADLGALPVRKRYIKSGKYITASGVSAGIDMALFLLETLVNKKHAQDLRFGIEYFPNQYHLLSSYSLPRFIMNKLSARFNKHYQPIRDKFRRKT